MIDILLNRWVFALFTAALVAITVFLLGTFFNDESSGLYRDDAEQRAYVIRRNLLPVVSVATFFGLYMFFVGYVMDGTA